MTLAGRARVGTTGIRHEFPPTHGIRHDYPSTVGVCRECLPTARF